MTADLTHPATSAPSDYLSSAVSAYLSRYKALSREHTHSDLRVFLTWCTGQGCDPLTMRRHQLELYVRWLPVQAVARLAAHLGGGRLLPHLCHRRSARPFPGGLPAAPDRARRVTHPGPD